MERLSYKTIDEALIQFLPELEPAKRALQAQWPSDKYGQYILFEDVFGHYIKLLLAEPDSEGRNQKLQKCFEFIDQMLASGVDVENLGYVGMLESMPHWWRHRAQPFLTLRIREKVEREEPGWQAVPEEPVPNLTHENDHYGVEEILRNVKAQW